MACTQEHEYTKYLNSEEYYELFLVSNFNYIQVNY